MLAALNLIAATTGDVTKAGKAIGLALGVGLGALGAGVGGAGRLGSEKAERHVRASSLVVRLDGRADVDG